MSRMLTPGTSDSGELVRQGSLGLATSPPLLYELRRVLRYPKLELGARERRTFLRDVRAHGRLVSPTRDIDLVRNVSSRTWYYPYK